MTHAHPTDAGLAGQLAPGLRGALAAVARVARALVGSGNFDELAVEALRQMRTALAVDVAALYLPVAGASALERHAATAVEDAALRPLEFVRFDAEAWGLAVRSGAPLVFQEQATWLQANPFEPPADYWLVLPLMQQHAVLGVVAAAAREPLAMTAADGIVLPLLGDLLSAGLATARLRQELQRAEVGRERMRLAAQVHDGLAQDLSLAVRELALLDTSPPDEVAAASRTRLRAAVATAHETVRARLLEFSAPAPIGGLAPAVEEICRSFDARGLPVAVRADDELPAIPPHLVTVTTRVLSEALLNVERHAQATRVTVTIKHGDGELTIAIADDGRGMSAGALAAAAAEGHLGVSLMHERARAAGGRLEVRSVPRAGTTLTLRLPVRVAA